MKFHGFLQSHINTAFVQSTFLFFAIYPSKDEPIIFFIEVVSSTLGDNASSCAKNGIASNPDFFIFTDDAYEVLIFIDDPSSSILQNSGCSKPDLLGV